MSADFRLTYRRYRKQQHRHDPRAGPAGEPVIFGRMTDETQTPQQPDPLAITGGHAPPSFDPDSTELRDFSRTVAEIEWLLVILVVLYHVFQGDTGDNTVAIYAGLVAYVVVILGFHYFNFVRQPQLWSLAVETWVMIVFVTWVLYHTGRLDSPLLNLYLLPIITSALTLGQKVTLLQVGLIAACYIFLGYTATQSLHTTVTAGDFATDLAPGLRQPEEVDPRPKRIAIREIEGVCPGSE